MSRGKTPDARFRFRKGEGRGSESNKSRKGNYGGAQGSQKYHDRILETAIAEN